MIQPKDFQPMQNIMKGFGYTFSNQGIDADVNGFPDFAVGAPFEKTGSVVLLRTIPVFKFDVKANVTYQLSKPTNETNKSKNCSTYKVFFKYIIHCTIFSAFASKK